MTELEYDNAVQEAEAIFLKKKKELSKEYAMSNNPHRKGDTIADHIGRIVIEEIKYTDRTGSSSYPSCVYFGVILNKDGSKNKRNEKRHVWQTNIKALES